MGTIFTQYVICRPSIRIKVIYRQVTVTLIMFEILDSLPLLEE